MTESAVLHDTIGRGFCVEITPRGDGGLGVGVTLGGHGPIGVAEGEPAQDDVADGAFRSEITFELEQIIEARRDDFGVTHVFAHAREVADDALLTIQLPFAGSVETAGRILDEVTRVGFMVGGTRVAGKRRDACLLVHDAEVEAEVRPREQRNDFDLPGVGPGFLDVTGLETELCGFVLRAFALDAEEAIIRRAGADGALAVHKE